jgi:hypothetical protein
MRGERERSWPREILFFSFSFSSFSSLSPAASCSLDLRGRWIVGFKLRLGELRGMASRRL